MSMSEWEQNVLSQLKAKARKVPRKKFFRVGIFFKSKEPTYVYYVPTSTYCANATDIDRAFKTLIKAFRKDSRIIDFDIDSVDSVPPTPSSLLESIERAREVIDDLAGKAFEEIRSDLPSDLKDRPERISLKGSIIGVHVRVMHDATTYDFLGADNPSSAMPLISFLHKKATEISESQISVSLTRAKKLKMTAIDRIKGYAAVYVEPLW